jgi:hypothetical protein
MKIFKYLLILVLFCGCHIRYIETKQAGMIPDTAEEIDTYIKLNEQNLIFAQKDLERSEKKLQFAQEYLLKNQDNFSNTGSRLVDEAEFNVRCSSEVVKSFTLAIELAKSKKEKLK